MKIRKLQLKDAPFMLEWMHNESVVKNMQTDFSAKTLKDCEAFIIATDNAIHDVHLAIADDNDVYMGTVSLKHITGTSAEFAIVVRKIAMGKGYSKYGMEQIIRIGLESLNLDRIYWYVSPDNKRAIRFYDKNGYQRINVSFLGNIEGRKRTFPKSCIIYGISRHKNC